MEKITKDTVKKFFREWGPTIGQLCVMGGIALHAGPAFAENTTSGTLTTITKPIEIISNTMQGPVATGITTIGAVVFGASWAANVDSQVTKGAMRIAGGSAVALGGANLIKETGAFTF